MAEIVWSEPALSDLDAIADYIALDNPARAQRMVRCLFEHVEHLASHPEIGSRPPELEGFAYHQIVAPPCRVLYRFDGECLYILHVLRTEQYLHPNLFRIQDAP